MEGRGGREVGGRVFAHPSTLHHLHLLCSAEALGTQNMCGHLALLGLAKEAKVHPSYHVCTGQAQAKLDGSTCVVYPALKTPLEHPKCLRNFLAPPPPRAGGKRALTKVGMLTDTQF